MSNEFKKWFAARARNPDRITLEEAFAAGARSQCAPDGWKLVPIEPTGEMVAAGSWGAAAGMRDPDVVELWKDMLAAAPEAKPCP